MKPSLHIDSPGVFTTIQDLGRPGYQHLGIPPSGALDPVAFLMANLLAGNAEAAPALEISCFGPEISLEADFARMGAAGGDAIIEVSRCASTQIDHIPVGESFYLRRGDQLKIRAVRGSAVLYLAVCGGIVAPPILGSAATYCRGRLGGHQGRALVAGDCLPINLHAEDKKSGLRISGKKLVDQGVPIRTVLGGQSGSFLSSALDNFFGQEYTVIRNDRMGLRLSGQAIKHQHSHDIISDAIPNGSIQVTGDGQPIVLLADRQTTGGYPKIATVISADLPAIGRLSVGSTLSFQLVSQKTALEARRAHVAEFAKLHEFLVPLRRGTTLNSGALMAENLISGVCNGQLAENMQCAL